MDSSPVLHLIPDKEIIHLQPALFKCLFAAVKQRMKSVTNIQKITKAMKMVAASRLRIAQAATFESRGIISPLVRLLGDLPGEKEYSLIMNFARKAIRHVLNL